MLAKLLLLLSGSLLLAQAPNWRKQEFFDFQATLERSNLSEPDKVALRKAIISLLKPGENTGVDKAPIRIIDVTGDGRLDVIVLGVDPRIHCSPTGNCWFKVFAKTTTGYVPILSDIGQAFIFERRPGSKSLDIIVGMHGSATDRTYKVYRFTGGKYQQIGCWDAAWAMSDDGKIAKEPVMERCKVW